MTKFTQRVRIRVGLYVLVTGIVAGTYTIVFFVMAYLHLY
jgi:hypothetical protein